MWIVIHNGPNVYVYHSTDTLRWFWFTSDEFNEWYEKNQSQVKEIRGLKK